MAFNILSMFQPAPVTPAATPAPTGNQTPGQPIPGTHSSAGTEPNGVVPTQSTKPEVSPLDQHKDIWQTPAKDPNKPDPSASPFANIDPAKLQEAAGKIDFSKVISGDDLAKISAGGQEAVAAFASAFNKGLQTVYAQSAVATTKIVEQALNHAKKQQEEALPGLVRKVSSHESLVQSNPIFSNPALSPIVEALQSQFQQKNPGATAADIQQQIVSYFDSIGAVFAPKQAQTAAEKQAADEPDWSKFFEMDQNTRIF